MMRIKAKDTVCYNIKFAWHAISRMYNEKAENYGGTSSIGFVLLNIDSEKGTPSTQIGPKLGMEATSLSRMLKTLEEKKLIYRVPQENDKRVVKIFLTEEGKKKKAIAKKVVKDFNLKVFEKVSPEKLKIFYEVIDAIIKTVEEEELQETLK
jgi:DNA-binding MarR family transcriptional regulator